MAEDKKGMSVAQWGAIATIVAALLGLCGIVTAGVLTGCFGRPEICGLATPPISTNPAQPPIQTLEPTGSSSGGQPTLTFTDTPGGGGEQPADIVLPIANFSANPTSGTQPLAVQFIDSSIGGIMAWDWDFGDGSGHDSIQNPSHIYNTTGDYLVTLMVVNSSNNSASHQDIIHVTAAPPTNTSPKLDLPAAMSVSGDVSGANVLYTVTAADAEDNPAPAPICDRSSGSHFPVGTTSVQCSVTDSGGLSDSGSFTVTVVYVPPVCQTKTVSVSVNPTEYMPTAVTRGDKDFGGHGPQVSVGISFRITNFPIISGTDATFSIEISMTAMETVSDFTTVTGSKVFTRDYKTNVSFIIPIDDGYVYDRHLTPLENKCEYLDTTSDTNWDTINASPSGPATYCSIIGDTPGNEAGTETRVIVHFNKLQFQERQVDGCR